MLKIIGIFYTFWSVINMFFLSWGFYAFAVHDDSSSKILTLPSWIGKLISIYISAVFPLVTHGNRMSGWFFIDYIPQLGFLIGGIGLLLQRRWSFSLLIISMTIGLVTFFLDWFYYNEKYLLGVITILLYIATIVYLVREFR